jgi:hypothetical protein
VFAAAFVPESDGLNTIMHWRVGPYDFVDLGCRGAGFDWFCTVLNDKFDVIELLRLCFWADFVVCGFTTCFD